MTLRSSEEVEGRLKESLLDQLGRDETLLIMATGLWHHATVLDPLQRNGCAAACTALDIHCARLDFQKGARSHSSKSHGGALHTFGSLQSCTTPTRRSNERMRGRAESRFQLLSLKGLLSLCKIPPEVLEGKRGNVFGVASASALKVGVRSRSQHSVLSSTAQPGRSEIIKEDTIYEESKDNNEEEERVEANIADLGAGELEEDSEEGQDEEEGEDEGNEDEGDPCNAMRCQGGFDATYQQTLGVDLGDRNTGVAVSWGDVGAPRSLQVGQSPKAPCHV